MQFFFFISPDKKPRFNRRYRGYTSVCIFLYNCIGREREIEADQSTYIALAIEHFEVCYHERAMRTVSIGCARR